MGKVASRLRETGLFQVAQIREPFVTDGYLLLVTDQSASKGLSLSDLFKIKGRGQRVIAAGDDENDLSLLEIADVKIAMAHAPEILRAKADFIAKPTHELGIIHALQIALSE
jgi:hydroxymethylpyrimidine pyrophosphatase-like HAD family hydrolase